MNAHSSEREDVVAKFDVVIRAGTIVDGTGGPPRTGDVAVDRGVVVEVGEVSGTGTREVNADGALVAPGFVDIHTHYDGQASWDERLQPSALNGVTTVVMGNCGVGFAPATVGDHDRLIELMEGVEDIPGVALREGLTWEWESFPEYLEALARRTYDIDVAAQVPHAALRVFAMGERASAYAQATPEEIGVMAELAREAVAAGAMGFSTSRALNHKSSSGELTPSYDAGAEELIAIARAIGQTGKGVLQMASDFHPGTDVEFAMMREMVKASGRPLSFSLAQSSSLPGRHRMMLDLLTEANEAGLCIRGQVPARGIGILLGLQCTLHPFMVNPVWLRISTLPPHEQAARMLDPALKAEMLAAQNSEQTPNISSGQFINQFAGMYELTDPPDYEPTLDTSITARAMRAGCSPEEVIYDIFARSGGTGMIYLFVGGYGAHTFDATYELLTHPFTIPGLSDGGAHVCSVCDGSFPTTLLQHWVRDRDGARLELPFVVQRQARDTALAVGLTDRGQIAPGFKADLNVIDLPALRIHRPEMHYDLPAGGKRLHQRVDGYKHTFVNGVETYRDGEPTGALPGRLVRST
jgi:N-acyl-D-aspartate/D-glutamate deacylase